MSHVRVLALIALICAPVQSAFAQLPSDDEFNGVSKGLKMTIRRGLRFLHLKYDPVKGGWGHPGVDALVLMAIVRSPDGKRYDDTDPFIRGPVDSLIKRQARNGSISHQGMLANYITSVSLLVLVEVRDRKMIKDADRAKRVADAIAKAKSYLLTQQIDLGKGKKKSDPMYGGVGYGGKQQRPDLSNTQLALEALRKAGVGADDAFVKRATTFLMRCQNRSESNDQPWAANDSGFVYYPGKSAAGTFKKADGKEGHRSYGSMTYAGIKAFIHAGVDWDDPLVKAAMGWVRKHYTVDSHPNLGTAGLYYYFHTFAKTMALWSTRSRTRRIKDAEGKMHDWAYDLAKKLQSLQGADGSWKNDNGRWMEGSPVLATTYAVLALNYCYPLKAETKAEKK